MKPEVILAYALFDAENTTRLSEYPDEQERYFERARQLLYAMREYRPKAERACLAKAIQKRSDG